VRGQPASPRVIGARVRSAARALRSADLFLYSAVRSTVAPRSSLLAFAFRRCSDTYVPPDQHAKRRHRDCDLPLIQRGVNDATCDSSAATFRVSEILDATLYRSGRGTSVGRQRRDGQPGPPSSGLGPSPAGDPPSSRSRP
jgi:hypothetical protein